MTLEKALAKAEKEKKDLYLQACLERRRTFIPMVYSADGIPGAEALDMQKRLAELLSYKLKWEYSEMCGFVQTRMSLAKHRYECNKGGGGGWFGRGAGNGGQEGCGKRGRHGYCRENGKRGGQISRATGTGCPTTIRVDG